MCSRKLSHLILMPVILGAVVSGNPQVMESSFSYPCCQSPAIPFDQHCENTWRKGATTFAHHKPGASPVCQHPCGRIEGGRMTLAECAGVEVDTVCTDPKGVAVENRTSYRSAACSGSAPGRRGGYRRAVALLAVVIAGFCMNI